MKKLILVLGLLFSGLAVSAQTEQTTNDQVFMIVEKMPEFPGGDIELRKFIATHLKYPDAALNAGISGSVYIRFIVDTDGSVIQPEVIRGDVESLNNEALRVVKLLPKFVPGMQRGQNVKVSLVVPIMFDADYRPSVESQR